MSVFSMNIEHLNMYYFVQKQVKYPQWTTIHEVNTTITLNVG